MVSALTRCGLDIPPAGIATIIPTYRRPELLPHAVESALAQTIIDHHIVVIDDGGGMLGALPESPRITALELPENVGCAGVVRNIGIRLSRSRLIAFLDDDNTWEADHLERAVQAHAQGAELTYSCLRRVDEHNTLVDILGEPFDRSAMRNRSLVDTNAMVIRRRPEVHFSRTPRHRDDFPGEDWEIAWRLSRNLKVQHIPVTTVRYMVHPGSHYTQWGDRFR
ncbi:MAG: glycosyltransferase family 2 protein [Microthrixaceae bacterium]|nr:glycosyltransferase family 2 protein [Microthrixaceae bacterium]